MFASVFSSPRTFLFPRPKFLRSFQPHVSQYFQTKPPPSYSSSSSSIKLLLGGCRTLGECGLPSARRIPVPRRSMAATVVSPGPGIAYDVGVAALTAASALALLRFWDEIAKRGVFDQILNRKLVHISVGLVFMLFWPLFSSSPWASYLAAIAPGVNVVRMILIGMGILQNDAVVKSMSRHGDHRELLKGPLYYACTITIATATFWRTSPVAISAICNLCAGDGGSFLKWHAFHFLLNVSMDSSHRLICAPWLVYFQFVCVFLQLGIADIVGRRFGTLKLPYNKEKSFIGTLAMFIAGFVASIWYMHYFAKFGLCDSNWSTVVGLLIVSLVASIVESLPISTELDDNLTVPLTSLFMGCLLF